MIDKIQGWLKRRKSSDKRDLTEEEVKNLKKQVKDEE